ncbi:MAG: hypothetical protein ACRDOH_25035, partial [Streptosporangiaceae bacterium]
ASSYVLADSSKLGAIAVHRVCPLSRVTAVLTDPEASAAGRGLPGRGRCQVHLRHGRVPAGHDRFGGGQVGLGAVRVCGLAARRSGDVLPGWAGLHGGFGGARRNGYLAVRPVRAEELHAR